MLDRAEFPRDKPCGGLVSVRCVNGLGLDLSPVIERQISKTFITFKQKKKTELFRSSDDVYAYATQRMYLDNFLAEQAVASGVTFNQREKLKGIDQGKDLVTIHTSAKKAYQGRVLVGADGVTGVTARLSGISSRDDYEYAIALEGNVTSKDFPDKWTDSLGLDFEGVSGGYACLFPKGDHVNIGLGGHYHVGPTLREGLKSLTDFYGFNSDDLWGVRGYSLPLVKLEDRRFTPANGNVVLVGDAAGFMDPLTAEGIWAAAHSAQIAASKIIQFLSGEITDLAESYTSALQQTILREIAIARQFRRVFYPAPGAYFAAEVVFPYLWNTLTDTFRGDSDYVEIFRKIRLVWPVVQLGAHSMNFYNSIFHRQPGKKTAGRKLHGKP